MKKKLPVRQDVPWEKRQEIPDPQVLDAADQFEQARAFLDAQPPGSGVVLPLMNTAAIAVELYLKCLSAGLIHVADMQMPEISRVYAAPAITSSKGHALTGLLDVMPPDVRSTLEAAFAAALGREWGVDLRGVLAELEGVFMAARYPFEHGMNISSYNLGHLMGLSPFLRDFVHGISPTDRITWKKGGITSA